MKTFRFSRETGLLFAILALAFFARAWGLNFGLPYLYHADEPIVVNHALAFGSGDLNPHFFKIPPLVSYLLFACYGIYYVLGRGIGFFHSVHDFEQLFYFDPTMFYLIARLIFGMLLGTISVYLFFQLVKRFWDARTALWASFFLATNFLHVRDSHYIYSDIPLLAVFLLGFHAIFRVSENSSSWRWHLFAGGVIGLAIATKYNGIFLAVPYLWVCLRSVSPKKWPKFCALAGFTAGVTFMVLNPCAILDHSFFLKEIREQSGANSGGFFWFHHLAYSLSGALGWPMLVLALLGVLRALFSKDLKSQAVAVFVVGYYVVLCRFGQPYDRYVLPLIPFMLFFSVRVLVGLKVRDQLLFWILIPFVAMPSLIKTVHWDRLMSEPDVRTVAKDWVERHIPAGSRLALDGGFYMPRLAFTARQLEEKKAIAQNGFQSGAKTRRIDALLSKPYQPSYELYFLSHAPGRAPFLFGEPLIPFDMNVLKQNGVQYVFLVDALRPKEDLFYQMLLANADRVMTFSPYRDPRDLTIHDPQTMTGGPFLWKDILPRERGGYPVSVYKIRS